MLFGERVSLSLRLAIFFLGSVTAGENEMPFRAKEAKVKVEISLHANFS